jgi:hypothetical protein
MYSRIHPIATKETFLAPLGLPAPSSLPTRMDAAMEIPMVGYIKN